MEKPSVPSIEFFEGNETLLDAVRPLWEKLNKQHEVNSPYFSGWFAQHTFAERKAGLVVKAMTGMRVELAKDSCSGQYIAYCISTISQERVGEIDSIYVEPAYRGRGVGDSLMRKALEWMETHLVKSKQLRVATGNEQVFEFYQRYGFSPWCTVLIQVSR